MLDHVTIGASDRAASRGFYDTVLRTLGLEAQGAWEEWGDFSLQQAGEDRAVTRGLHIGFVAPTHDHVRAFWQAGVDAGHRSDGEPGPRPEYGPDYYGAFLLDPDGNSAEAAWHDDLNERSSIDHLWVRVADVAVSRRFYDTIAEVAGFEEHPGRRGRVQYGGPGERAGTFSLLEGEPTAPFHLAFGVASRAAVDEFHRRATAAGYTDNGPPGPRPEYHDGYYGAFVIDPDGHNVEAVFHDR